MEPKNPRKQETTSSQQGFGAWILSPFPYYEFEPRMSMLFADIFEFAFLVPIPFAAVSAFVVFSAEVSWRGRGTRG
jgi:hypothetical protein